jgi:hypothetical protein
MPLHDWNESRGWDGVHLLWITELLRWVKPRLPAGYRAYVGSVPTVAIGGSEKPEVSVRQWPEPPSSAPVTSGTQSASADEEPDEQIAVVTLDPEKAVYVAMGGRLIAAIELISPRNKDRPDAQMTYLMRYLAYLYEGVHLLLVDAHRRPLHFSFADRIAEELGIRQPAVPPPMAVSYRVGAPAATGGRNLGIWRRLLTVGTPLPTMRLSLDVGLSVPVDLEQTYMHAAADAYLP